MALINEKLPNQISAKFTNEIINIIYSYCGNSQYDVVLRQLKNIIDSSIPIIREQRRRYINYEMSLNRYILSKNNYKMYLNGIINERFIIYDITSLQSRNIMLVTHNREQNEIFDQILPNYPIINEIFNEENANYLLEDIYSDTESESDSDSDIPDLEENSDRIYLCSECIDNEIF